VLRVNTTSVYLCCKYAIPIMQAQGKGSIINTASFVALMGAATSQIAYTASKGGVLAMTRELGPDALHSFTDEKNVFLATDGCESE
jgi:NAD(P)-dependent dehydrogenase (short-subunit alcohol dehydrogenase family)